VKFPKRNIFLFQNSLKHPKIRGVILVPKIINLISFLIVQQSDKYLQSYYKVELEQRAQHPVLSNHL
jgi:hypothetical protein